MTDVVLIRPGSNDFDEQERIQGSLNLPLTERGREQVEALSLRLRETGLTLIYSSPSEPARSTAATIGRELGVPVKELKGLRNLDQGLWQGMQIDDIRRKYPRVVKQWRESPETVCPPGGEPLCDALQRARTALTKPLKRKEPFAVVASEPLATLVRCIILEQKPGFPGPLCGGGHGELMEVLHTNGALASNNGSDRREGD